MASENFKTRIDIKPVAEILKRHGLNEGGAVTLFLRNEVDRYSDPYIPFKKANLKNNKSYPNPYSIKYNSPYARIHYHGKVMIDPVYKVGGFYNKKTKSWYSRRGVKKVVSNKNFKYNEAPKRGAYWDKRMWNDRGKEICNNLEDFIKKYVR